MSYERINNAHKVLTSKAYEIYCNSDFVAAKNENGEYALYVGSVSAGNLCRAGLSAEDLSELLELEGGEDA